MPLYEYQCESCGSRFERIQKFSDLPVQACPSCGGPVRKLLSSPAIQFKGSGWYITDYAKKPSAEATDKKPTATDGASSDTPGAASTTTTPPSSGGSPSTSTKTTKED